MRARHYTHSIRATLSANGLCVALDIAHVECRFTCVCSIRQSISWCNMLTACYQHNIRTIMSQQTGALCILLQCRLTSHTMHLNIGNVQPDFFFARTKRLPFLCFTNEKRDTLLWLIYFMTYSSSEPSNCWCFFFVRLAYCMILTYRWRRFRKWQQNLHRQMNKFINIR